MLVVVLLAEIDLYRRAGVPRGRSGGHALRPMEVTERDIVGVGREAQPVDAVIEDGLRVPLPTTHGAAVHETVCGDDVDRVGPESVAQRGDEETHALGVEPCRLRGIERQQLLGADREPL